MVRLNESGGGRDGARIAMSVVREPRGRYWAAPCQISPALSARMLRGPGTKKAPNVPGPGVSEGTWNEKGPKRARSRGFRGYLERKRLQTCQVPGFQRVPGTKKTPNVPGPMVLAGTWNEYDLKRSRSLAKGCCGGGSGSGKAGRRRQRASAGCSSQWSATCDDVSPLFRRRRWQLHCAEATQCR